MSDKPNQLSSILVFWLIWVATLKGLTFLQALFGGGTGLGDNHGLLVAFQVGGLLAAALSLVVRFLVIPRLQETAHKLPAMIIGLAFAEAVGIIGIVVVPTNQEAVRLFLLSLSIICIVVSAPIYVLKRKSSSPFHMDKP